MNLCTCIIVLLGMLNIFITDYLSGDSALFMVMHAVHYMYNHVVITVCVVCRACNDSCFLFVFFLTMCVHVCCRCSSHPLQCDESTEGVGGGEVVGGKTGILAQHPSLQDDRDQTELSKHDGSEETTYLLLDAKRPSGYLETTH